MLIGMSQERLGDSLGITFQQVQKYEKGTNRIGAGRLHQIADVLGVTTSYFYDEAPGSAQAAAPGFADGDSTAVMTFVSSSEGLLLNKAFARIRDAKVRRNLIELATTLAQPADADDLPSQE